MNDKTFLEMIESALAEIKYPAVAPHLFAPVSYALESGGKRIRPMLVLECCAAVGGNPECAINQALAIEMFHNFTLIHDDVMDGARLRRGRLTVYRRWNANQAILSGDALLTMATARVVEGAGDRAARVLDLFNRTALEVYEGQQLDIDYERYTSVTPERYFKMVRLKTSVLLGAACAMGAIMGGADDKTVDALYAFGENLGVAFQLRDDWLDVYGDNVFGKTIGNDIVTRKKTWMYIMAHRTAGKALEEAYTARPRGHMIARVKAIYTKYGLSRGCLELIDNYCAKAIEALAKAEISADARTVLATLVGNLSHRAQ